MVYPRSYRSSLMRRTISMSFLLYTRWPDLDFSGARFGNSLSQNRRTKGSISTILQTSPILKKSLSGIWVIKPWLRSCGSLRALLDYNGRPGEWKSFANPVFDEALEGEVQFLHFIRKHDESRGIDLH